MKVLRNRLLVTLIFAAIALALGSSAALAFPSFSFGSTTTTTGSTSVSWGDRPATTSSGDPDVGGPGNTTPNRELRPVYTRWDYDGAWRTWISRIWASWSLRGVR